MVAKHTPIILHEAGGTEPEAMGAPRQHPMAMEATARFGGHTVCRWGAGRCDVRVRVSRTLSSSRQPLSYVRGSESAHFHVHPLSCRAPLPRLMASLRRPLTAHRQIELARGYQVSPHQVDMGHLDGPVVALGVQKIPQGSLAALLRKGDVVPHAGGSLQIPVGALVRPQQVYAADQHDYVF